MDFRDEPERGALRRVPNWADAHANPEPSQLSGLQSEDAHHEDAERPLHHDHAEQEGLIPPGLSEEIEIEFRPTEWRYYYDCIRIHTEDGNMLIPIHAYPTLNEVNFPKRIDFGRCDLSESMKKVVKLEYKVPLDFEFSVEMLGDSPEFGVHPSSGVLSKGKATEISVTYQPMRSATSTVQLKVTVATANSKPVICDVTGSGYPGSLNARISNFSTIDPSNLTAEELLTLSAEKKRKKADKNRVTYGRAG